MSSASFGSPVAAPREGMITVQPTFKEKAQASGRQLIPATVDWIDLAFSAALMAVVLMGFRTGYFGWAWIAAAVSGLVLGLLISHVMTAFRLPAVATLGGILVAYFLLGGPLAVRDNLIFGVIPSGQTFKDLASTLVHGWKRLLTMLPPVDAIGPLLALPLLVGLVGAAVTYTVARRWTSPYAVLLAPLALLALVIALGTLEPAGLVVQGVVFALLAIGWLVVRAARNRAPLQNGAGQNARLAIGGGLLAVAALAGYFAGPHLPGADEESRRVARSAITPPFDIAQFPSPLAGYRKYTEPNTAKLWDRELLSVKGVPKGTPLRFATLDDYDGSVWGASNRANNGTLTPGAAFQQVGSQVATRGPGQPTTVRVTVPKDGYSDVWLPTMGTVRGVHFDGDRAKDLASRLWLNIDTNTALVPDRLRGGDAYTMDVLLPATPGDLPKSAALESGSLTDDVEASFLDSKLDAWTGEASDPWSQLVAIAKAMQSTGAYTDGGNPNSNTFERLYLPGHGLDRVTRFVGTKQLAGNDEQYAATLALAANRLNIPARVVMGAITTESGVVKGQDVHAWVEVRDSNGTWIPLLHKDFVPDRNKKPAPLQTKTDERKVGALVPPPAGVNPPSVLQGPDQAQNATNLKKPPKKLFDPSAWPAWLRWLVFFVIVPALALLAVYGLIRLAKEVRRRRHATRGPTTARVAWAWEELVVTARSYGHRMPRRATRLEQASSLRERVEAGGLAVAANAHIFGPGEPTEDEAVAYWKSTDEARKDLRANVDFWKRLRSDLDLRPLFSSGPATSGTSASGSTLAGLVGRLRLNRRATAQ